MIILDTNVVSGLMKSDDIVVKWLDKLEVAHIWITSITVMEMQYGINLKADGKKKASLQKSVTKMIQEDFHNHVLEFDIGAAYATAEISASLKKDGKNVDIRDLQIAGIALARDAYIATRNKKDFIHTGVKLINPWD